MSGRLEEMPGDEGYPAYLGSRLAEYYERAGQVIALEKIIVKEALQRLVRFRHLVGTYQNLSPKIRYAWLKVFWGLDSQLAQNVIFLLLTGCKVILFTPQK